MGWHGLTASLATARGRRAAKKTVTTQSTGTAGALTQGGGGGAVAGVVKQQAKTVRANAGHSAASAGIGFQYAVDRLKAVATRSTRRQAKALRPSMIAANGKAAVSAGTLSRGHGKANATLNHEPNGTIDAASLR